MLTVDGQPFQHISDPNESNPDLLWAEIHQLRADAQGPDGFPTWRAAACSERERRVRAERNSAHHMEEQGWL